MTRRELAEAIRPLLECTGVDDHDEPVCFKCNRIVAAIEAALDACVDAETERCAKVVEDGVMATYHKGDGMIGHYHSNDPANIAAAIRGGK